MPSCFLHSNNSGPKTTRKKSTNKIINTIQTNKQKKLPKSEKL